VKVKRFCPVGQLLAEATVYEVETIDEQQAIRFLLGDLPEESRTHIEENFFKDDRFYSQLLALQEELADDYVHKRLSSSDRAKFESSFLKSLRRRQRVEFAAAFSKALTKPEEPVAVKNETGVGWLESVRVFFTPMVRLTAVTTALVLALLVGASWLWIENRRLAKDVQQAKMRNESLTQAAGVSDAESVRKQQDLEREIAALRSKGGEMETTLAQKERELEALKRARTVDRSTGIARAIASFVLQPGLTRGTDEPERLVIPAAAQSIQVQLDLEREENFQSYVAEIRTARGNLAWSKSGLTLQKTTYGRAAVLTIPATVVSNGEYEITLKGVSNGKTQAVGYYYFIALRR